MKFYSIVKNTLELSLLLMPYVFKKKKSNQMHISVKVSIDPSKMDMMHDNSSNFCAWY